MNYLQAEPCPEVRLEVKNIMNMVVAVFIVGYRNHPFDDMSNGRSIEKKYVQAVEDLY